MILSVIHDPSLKYPSSEDYFSPDKAWPEYQLGHLSRKPNPVYAAVRRCFAYAGLDKDNFGKETWNPLGSYISPGNRVFLLCNFVEQKSKRISDETFFAKCTHGSVIRAVLDYVILALGGDGAVSFGNAPLQSCNWPEVVEQTGGLRVQEFFTEVYRGNIKVLLSDLRQHIIRRRALGGVEVELHDGGEESCVEVDLAVQSLLDIFFDGTISPKLRVLDYDPRRTEKCHRKGRHIYLINREIIDSDVIISIPKLKTHEKVGISCGIKGCVGAVGHKDCLAHHRYGPPNCGGDEYPNKLWPLRVVSAIHDSLHTRNPGVIRGLLHSVDFFSRKFIRRFSRAPSGSWPGNDTCWRMAVDLARIIAYTDRSGQLQMDKQRTHLMLTDGIIAGEGDGPLSPKPVFLGYMCCSDNVVMGDYVNALAMGFNPQDLPMIREALDLRDYPLIKGQFLKLKIPINGKAMPIETLGEKLGKKFQPPKEWRCML